jgi:outer membrane protein assembly factor BamB
MRLFLTLLSIPLFCVVTFSTGHVRAEDWPEWRGEGRRGVWSEEGIVQSFPEQGLTYTWRVPVAEGYAGPAVAGGRVFVSDFVRASGLRGTERALCLDEKSGEVLWKREWPVDYSGTQPKWASGPRATPTVDGDRVYFIGGMGMLWALETETGKPLWKRDLVAEFEAEVPAWGVASAPLVDGDLLVTLVGGTDGAGVVAFDKRTGEERWRAVPETGDPGYAPPLIVEAGGVRQLIVWHAKAIYSLEPPTGKVLWKQPHDVGMAMSVATPVAGEKHLLVSSFFDGAMMLRLSDDTPGAEVLWHKKGESEQPQQSRGLHALITTPVIDGEMIYGIGSYGELRGLKVSTGERVWESLELIGEQARWAAGLIVRNGNRYLVNTDRGELVLARFTPKGYEEIDRTFLIEPTSGGGGRRELDAVNWSHPAYANGHIVARNDREIVRASLRAEAYSDAGKPSSSRVSPSVRVIPDALP